MSIFTVDTDGTSGTYASLSAALAALPDPFTEDNYITLAASTAVKDTANATGVVLDTTTDYRLYITGDENYIYSPPDASELQFLHAFGNTYNITIDGINFEKPSMTANYQSCLHLFVIRDGDIIIKNCNFISDSGITLRERLLELEMNASYNATVTIVNNYFRTKGSDVGAVTTCIGHMSDLPAYVYNNTFVGQRANYTNASLAIYKNNILNTVANGNTVSTSSDYNMFSGAFDFGGTNDEQSQTFTFDDLANDDVHLAAADTGARGKGTDLSSDANYPFSTDKDGVTRSAWDAGAYEYVATGGGVNLTPDIKNVGFTSYDANVSTGINQTASITNLGFTSYTAAVTTGAEIIAELKNVGFESFLAEVSTGVNITPELSFVGLQSFSAIVEVDDSTTVYPDILNTGFVSFEATVSTAVDIKPEIKNVGFISFAPLVTTEDVDLSTIIILAEYDAVEIVYLKSFNDRS